MRNLYDNLYTGTVGLDALCGRDGSTVEDLTRKLFAERKAYKARVKQLHCEDGDGTEQF